MNTVKKLICNSTSTYIGMNTEISGNFYFEDSALLDGKITGEVLGSGTVTVGKTGQIEGDIIATNIIISGIVRGNVAAHSNITVTGTGQLYGNISNGKPLIQEGGIFAGKCLTDINDMSEITKPSL